MRLGERALSQLVDLPAQAILGRPALRWMGIPFEQIQVPKHCFIIPNW